MKLKLPWMSRTDRRRWRSTHSLADLGGLMALWLEGEIASQPGYAPNWGPDEETTEAGLVPVLAACNRAGYVTIASQPGFGPGPGYDGLIWAQRTAVEGFVKDPGLLRRLVDAADAAGLEVELADQLDTGENGLTVTTRDGRPYTAFGGYLDDPNLRTIWPGIGTAALSEVFGAVRVTIAAPEYGTGGDRLWNVLAQAIEQPVVCTVCGCTDAPFASRICGDGCSGVVNQADGRCQACIDPGVLIDWSKVQDDDPKECALCGAPFYSAARYCSEACETADNPADAAPTT